MKFFIITPVRDEEDHIGTTIECMVKQTILPAKWIIVNDGSTDNTEMIVKKNMIKIPFLDYIYLSDRGYRKPGGGVIEAFYEGFRKIMNIKGDNICYAKFDADLEFPPDMLEKISEALNNDPKLGITGGTRYERININGPFKKVIVPKGFVGGPYKFYRKKCFEDINGIIKRAGWDGVDIIKANMKGWSTGEIESLKIYHLKPTGTSIGEGWKKACEKYGDVSYYMGGYIWYFVLRIIGRSLSNRNPLIGYYMIKGYMKSKYNGLDRQSQQFRDFLKKTQISNIIYWIRFIFRRYVR